MLAFIQTGERLVQHAQTAYKALRREVVQVLMGHRSQGRFINALGESDPLRTSLLANLTQSIADILIVAKPTGNADATVLADAENIARAVLLRPLPHSRGSGVIANSSNLDGDLQMAKHQRSNWEVRKPKADKKKLPAATSSFSPAPGMPKPLSAARKKGR